MELGRDDIAIDKPLEVRSLPARPPLPGFSDNRRVAEDEVTAKRLKKRVAFLCSR